MSVSDLVSKSMSARSLIFFAVLEGLLCSRVIGHWESKVFFSTALGYEPARVESMALPVFPCDPLEIGEEKNVIYDLLVSIEGELIASGAYYLPDQRFSEPMKVALENATFSPALENSQKTLSFLRTHIVDYFFVPGRSLPKDFEPAKPLWIVDRDLATDLSLLCYHRKEINPLVIIFSIDSSGTVTRLKGTDEISNLVIDRFLEAMQKQLRFDPARSGGKSVASKLFLRLTPELAPYPQDQGYSEANRVFPQFAIRNTDDPMFLRLTPELASNPQDQEYKEANRVLPEYPKIEDTGQSFEVTVVTEFDNRGGVVSARIPGEVPEPFVVEALKAVRAWRLDDAATRHGSVAVTQYIRFGFQGGRDEAELLEEPRSVEFHPYEAVSDPPIKPLSQLWRLGLSMVFVADFIVTEEGRAVDVELRTSSHPKLTEQILDGLERWEVRPAERDGVKVSSRGILIASILPGPQFLKKWSSPFEED